MHTVEETAGTEVLQVRLLGELDLRLGSRPLPALDSGRAETLLAFLLWPDSTEAQARANLRHVLHNLRRALPELDRYLEITPRTLRWQPGTPLWLDVAEFEQAVATTLKSPRLRTSAAPLSVAGAVGSDWTRDRVCRDPGRGGAGGHPV